MGVSRSDDDPFVALVREQVEDEPIMEDIDGWFSQCRFCDSGTSPKSGPVQHLPDCWWLRARTALQRHDELHRLAGGYRSPRRGPDDAA